MESELIKKTVEDLMEKFGAGNHKPGSGSAAAFQGMISAKLISTVISLTADEKRRHLYSHYILELLDFQEQIERRIYPTLVDLFQFDSEQFDKTIKLRIARNEEKDEATENQLRRQALEELKIAIAIPLQIATLCNELAEISAYVFDNGFKSARGDSQVGLSGAVSALAGCMAIIRLNVLSFNSDEFEYCKSVVSKVDNLDNEYQRLNKLANSKIKILQAEFEEKIPLFQGVNDIIKQYRGNIDLNIEQCARALQNLVWTNRHLIWKKNIPNNELQILRPDLILKRVLGYDYFSSTRFGIPSEGGEVIVVAGIIDQPNKLVAVSNSFSPEIQKFTAAHELGHAILHEQPILHRDIPTDCAGKRKTRDKTEVHADKFATFFLMPTKSVQKEFEKIFSSKLFELNENSAFKFGGRSTSDIRRECKNLRGFSRKLAALESFENKEFTSLSNKFNVSTEAMAIRLEELGLLRY
ncbi:MAG: cyclodeaminase/cyclohydrolase family protein [Saonia sp.]